MSAGSLSGLFQVLAVKRSELIGKASDIVSVFLSTPERDPDDPTQVDANDETEPAEWWTPYGLYSRPPEGSQTFLVRAGATFAAVASRVSDIGKIVGKLAEGDVALFSEPGRNVIRLNANGSVSVLVRTSNGKNLAVRLDPKGSGSIKAITGAGQVVEVSEENGIVLNAGMQPITLTTQGIIQLNAAALLNNAPVLVLQQGAAKPLVSGVAPVPGVFTR